jgi:hypothetical protein
MNSEEALPGAVASLRANPSANAADLAAEPLFIGDFPLAISLGPVECTTRHLATFRLDPHHFEVRQRILFAGRDERTAPDRLRTVALGILPNPALDVVARQDCPRLQLRDARLIAAVMRAVLPSIYRGSEVDIQVALHVEADQAGAEHELEPGDGFYLYDPHLGGNGAAHAIHRDGVELLLRLCRLYLERVLPHDRLRARYDFWADPDELLSRRPASLGGPETGETEAEGAESALERDEAARTRALDWLNSRLRPEGSAGGGRGRVRIEVGAPEPEIESAGVEP